MTFLTPRKNRKLKLGPSPRREKLLKAVRQIGMMVGLEARAREKLNEARSAPWLCGLSQRETYDEKVAARGRGSRPGQE